MEIIQLDAPKVIMSNPLGRHKYFGWPTLTRLRDGRLAASASGFRIAHVCPFGKAVVSFSNDDGKSYTPPTIVIDTVLDDRDCGLCPFGESGLIVTSFNNSVSFQRKVNDGCKAPIKKAYIDSYLDSISQEEETEVIGSLFRVSFDNGDTFGKIYKSPITSPHGPAELKNGDILWVGAKFGGAEILAYKLDPFNGEMTYIGKIDTDELKKENIVPAEPYVFELDDGTLICHIRADRGGERSVFTLYQSVSKDGGATWSKPMRILAERGGAPAHIMRHSSGVLISSYGYRDRDYGIKAMFSTDDGKTWDTDNYIYRSEGDSSDLGYPCTVELEDGSLLTAFYIRQEYGVSVIMQQRWTFKL